MSAIGGPVAAAPDERTNQQYSGAAVSGLINGRNPFDGLFGIQLGNVNDIGSGRFGISAGDPNALDDRVTLRDLLNDLRQLEKVFRELEAFDGDFSQEQQIQFVSLFGLVSVEIGRASDTGNFIVDGFAALTAVANQRGEGFDQETRQRNIIDAAQQSFGIGSAPARLVQNVLSAFNRYEATRIALIQQAERAQAGSRASGDRGLLVEPSGTGSSAAARIMRMVPANGEPAAIPGYPGWQAFVTSSFAKFKDDDNADTDGLEAAFVAGLARQISDDLVIGAFFKYRHVNSDSRIFLSAFDMDFFGGGLLVNARLPADLIFKAAASYEHGRADATLAVDRARFDMDVFSVQARLSRPFLLAPWWVLEPLADFAYVNHRTGSYTDSGGTSTGAVTAENGRFSFGAKLKRAVPVLWNGVSLLTLEGSVLGLVDVINGKDFQVGRNTATEPDHGVAVSGAARVTFDNGSAAGASFTFTTMDKGYRSWALGVDGSVPLEAFIAGGKGKSMSRLPDLWAGGYIGLSVGGGSSDVQITNLISGATSGRFNMRGFVGGLLMGSNLQLVLGNGNSLVIGAESEILAADVDGKSRVAVCGQPGCNSDIEYLALKRARLGMAFGPVMPYATAGFAAGLVDANFNFNTNDARIHYGYTVGGGIECACGDSWRARLDYAFADLGAKRHTLGNIPYRVDPAGLHLVRAMVTFDVDFLGLLN